jgi:predicted house-cleaning noncanonical NTP pyrophosphatase (MazG superfamily)
MLGYQDGDRMTPSPEQSTGVDLTPAPEGYPIKLVRDQTADVINASGEPGDLFYGPVRGDVTPWLRRKLVEEVAEYIEGRTLEELADVFAVISALAETHGRSVGWLKYMADRHPRGGFRAGVMMYGRHDEFDGGRRS